MVLAKIMTIERDFTEVSPLGAETTREGILGCLEKEQQS